MVFEKIQFDITYEKALTGSGQHLCVFILIGSKTKNNIAPTGWLVSSIKLAVWRCSYAILSNWHPEVNKTFHCHTDQRGDKKNIKKYVNSIYNVINWSNVSWSWACEFCNNDCYKDDDQEIVLQLSNCFSTTSNKGKQILLNSSNKKNTLIYVWRMTLVKRSRKNK